MMTIPSYLRSLWKAAFLGIFYDPQSGIVDMEANLEPEEFTVVPMSDNRSRLAHMSHQFEAIDAKIWGAVIIAATMVIRIVLSWWRKGEIPAEA